MKITDWVSISVTIFLGIVGIIVTIVSPWIAPWIAQKASSSLLVGRVIGVVFLSVVVGVVIGVLLLRLRSTDMMRSGNSVVSEECFQNVLVSTLTAFKVSIATRYRELHNEHELTRKNQRYHQQQIWELIQLDLLGIEAPWLYYSTCAHKWQPHLAQRRNLDKMLREIYHILCAHFIPAKYSIALAGHRARAILRYAVNELNNLKKLREDEGNLETKK